MNWQQQIPGCFGAVDLVWATHPQDQKRARDTLKAAIGAGATMQVILDAAEMFLQGKKATAQHIQTELAKIRNLVI